MSRPKTILLAGQALEIQRNLADLLESNDASIEVHTVPAGKDVLTYLQKCPPAQLPCLALIEYNLPVLSGLELLQILVKDKRYAKVSFAIRSESATEDVIAACKNAGAKAFYTRPSSDLESQHQVLSMLELCGSMVNSDDEVIS
jgi:CheY-like chemotaxis protein